MSSNVMRPIEERHVPSQVELMVWCPCLDLLALSNSKGEVQLHRLNWHKVWSLAPPAEGSLVGGIAWRPDGKVLAVGYTCGKIYLVDVEDKEILFINKAGTDKSNPGAVTCLSWKQKCANTNSHVSYGNFNNVNTYLPLPPTINPSFKKNEKNALANDTKRKKELTELNIMLVGYENGEIHMSVFGQFLCGILNVNNYMDAQQNRVIEAKFTKIVDVRLSPDFTMIQVFYEADNKSMNLFMLNTETLAAFSEELHSLALMYVHLTSVINYIDGTVTSIIESWEQILLEMDSKLEKYACNVAEGGVSADFLDLLILGVPSAELKIFLLQDLTAKGLKKFGTSIELSYSTIQKLVLKQLNTVCQNLSFHLSDLRGLSRITHRYPVLGLDEDLVNFAIISSNAFVNKCLELQQVIEHSMKNYKAFFRWLFVVIVRLMDEHVPSDISKINQQDLTYIAEFLQNFDKVGVEKNPGPSGEGQSVDTGEKKRGKFSLERLGQYLVERELTMLPEDDNNPWKQFLSENPCLNNNPGIIQNFKKFSLVQQQGQLRYAIENVFRQSEKSLAQHYRAFLPIECVRSENMNNVRLTQINDLKANSVLVVFTDPDSQEAGCYFAEITFRNRIAYPKCAYFFFNIPLEVDESKLEDLAGDYLPVADAQFYSIDILSLLLKRPNDEEVCVFVQFPVEIIRKHLIEVTLEKGMSICSVESIEKKNAFSILEKTSFNVIDKLCGNKFAVSGSRKVAVVLSKTCRKVKLFEMEADGEEDDDETLDPNQTAHNSSQNSDPSQYVTMNESNFSTNPVNDDNQMEETEDSDDSSEMV